MFLYEKKDKTRCSLGLFYRYHFFSRSFTNDCRSASKRATRNNQNHSELQYTSKNNYCKLFFKKEEDINPELVGRPIIDISGWQLPSEIDYDVLSQNVGGVIVRVHSGAQAKKENAATYLNGLDKSFKTHIQEFQKRNIPVAVYAYVAAKDKKEMEKEAEEFYKAASPYKPTYYWLDVEEKL